VGSLYLSNFNSPKRNDLYAIAIVNKNLVNRTVSFENELVPLNGRIYANHVMLSRRHNDDLVNLYNSGRVCKT